MELRDLGTADFDRERRFEFSISQRDIYAYGSNVLSLALEKATNILATQLVEAAEKERQKMKIEVYNDASKNGWRWRAIDSNGRIIADGSEAYANKQNAVRGLQNTIYEMRAVSEYIDPSGDRVSLNMEKSGEE